MLLKSLLQLWVEMWGSQEGKEEREEEKKEQEQEEEEEKSAGGIREIPVLCVRVHVDVLWYDISSSSVCPRHLVMVVVVVVALICSRRTSIARQS